MDSRRDNAQEHCGRRIDLPELRALKRQPSGARDACHLALTDHFNTGHNKGGTQHKHQSEKRENTVASHMQALVGTVVLVSDATSVSYEAGFM